ncbi:MAG: YkgJ family cysteine cluster protein [Spirochaetales bacterium]|nr:YkgJ family cysteine cluster protein [Spirochaetales bacterium]
MTEAEYTRKALKELPVKYRKRSRELLQYLRKLRSKNPSRLDYIFAEIHEQVFARYDCLACANCCRILGPKFLKRDIEQAAAFIGMHPKTFRLRYLTVDDDNDFVLLRLPCSFLQADNSCFIYPERPKACAEYPHTDSRNMRGLLMVTHKNIAVCPAAFEIVEEMEKKIRL